MQDEDELKKASEKAKDDKKDLGKKDDDKCEKDDIKKKEDQEEDQEEDSSLASNGSLSDLSPPSTVTGPSSSNLSSMKKNKIPLEDG